MPIHEMRRCPSSKLQVLNRKCTGFNGEAMEFGLAMFRKRNGLDVTALVLLIAICFCGCSVTGGRNPREFSLGAGTSPLSEKLPPKADVPIRLSRKSTDTNPTVNLVSHTEAGQPPQEPVQIESAIVGIGQGLTSMTLEQFEDLALRNNPTIVQAMTDVKMARALQDQVGRLPNPTLGYFGSQIGDAGTDQHGIFLEQELVRGGKLSQNQEILRHAIEAQAAAVDAQTSRVLTDVRIKFFVALAAQEQVRLAREFKTLAAEAVDVAEKRKQAEEGSQPELLQAQVQLSEIDLVFEQAEVALASAIQDLAAIAGVSNVGPIVLDGELDPASQPFDWEQVFSNLLTTSPEMRVAQARVQQACAQLQREQLQTIPNPTVQLGAGIDNGTSSELLNVQVSAPIPVFNSNHGNICAAKASYEKAAQEISRIELAIKSRLANVSREYDSALAAVRRYDLEILPRSKESLNLSEQVYRAGEIEFLQVFLVRKTYFESNLRYIDALSELAQSRARIEGQLLEGGLNELPSFDVDDSNRERSLSQR